MRQGQQHRRGRGRNNNNNHRKGHNPLARSFESNGPDVKVRGTPAHIAEKYLSLARDAQSSGDPVLAENYLQHAEHYNRIIMAYREQQMQQSGEAMNGGVHRLRPGQLEGGDAEEGHDEDVDDLGQGEQPAISAFPHEQQRFQPHGPRGGDDEPRQQRHDQGRFRDRHSRHERQYDRQNDRQNDMRGDMRPMRDRGDRSDRSSEAQQPVTDGAPPQQQQQPPPQQARPDQPQRRRERFGPGNEQPEFLRRPVRRPRREVSETDENASTEGREEGSQDKPTV
jgi:hypothetical protein